MSREQGRLLQDFPRIDPEPLHEPLAVAEALGCPVLEVWQSKELMVVLESEQAVRNCVPDMAALAQLPGLGGIVTAWGERYDVVSRYLAPGIGIAQDPVTGSTHCTLIPYWAECLGKSELSAFQCSRRGNLTVAWKASE